MKAFRKTLPAIESILGYTAGLSLGLVCIAAGAIVTASTLQVVWAAFRFARLILSGAVP